MGKGFHRHSDYYPCRCFFVPPYVIENLAKSGYTAAVKTALQDEVLRTSRATALRETAKMRAAEMPLENMGVVPPPGTAGRRVYSSDNTTILQKTHLRDEGDPVCGDDAGDTAYEYGGKVRDYYHDVLNRNSIDGLGLNQIHNVHYSVDYDNAFWDGSQMVYGDGDGTLFINFTKDLDVIGHELTHGVTQYTAALNYYSQSGALNESFSDVFGSVIDQAAEGRNAGNADWLVGNDIMGPTLVGEAIRSMKAPGTAYDNPLMGKDPQPDNMSKYYAGPADNQGVHINSGIINKAFYLVSMDIDTSCAGLIWYAALQNLWPTAVFSDMAYVTAEMAKKLVKTGEVPAGAVQSVRAAFRAVGL